MEPDKYEPTFVVGIGASAGGLDAIERVFDQMPEDLGVAFVLVQHLSPDFESLMDELLGRWTQIPIRHAENNVKLERDNIYLLPPGKDMVVSQGRLLLSDKDSGDGPNYPIDNFFRSLAQDFGVNAISVVLSGTGTDGSRGIRDVHEVGGLVIAQREETAKFNGMPRSARDSGATDLILSPEEIPSALKQFVLNPTARCVGFLENDASKPVDHVLNRLSDAFDVDFTLYKRTQVDRRIRRRMMLANVHGLAEYSERLSSDQLELELLYKDLLIGVTGFFRDAEAFDALARQGVRKLIDNAREGEDIRVWVTCCATGEEAYSIAILFQEELDRIDMQVQVKIFATDVNRQALDFAAKGVYSSDRIAGLSPERREKYFTRSNDQYQIVHDTRQMIVFAPHNLVKDPPFTKIALIACRNMLIYLSSEIQQKVLSLFHFGLKTGGVMFLGSSETCGQAGDGFEVLERRWKIFEKAKEGRIPDQMRMQFAGQSGATKRVGGQKDELLLSTYDALLATVMPPSLLVSDTGKLLHTFGNAGTFLRLEQGRSKDDFIDRIAPEFQVPVSAAMRKAAKDKTPVTYSGVRLGDEGRVYDVTVNLIESKLKYARSFLVQISEREKPTQSQPVAIDFENISADQIAELEVELRQSKQNLQATIEELESSNEELQATNEELVASNEELQSTNEELHSVNEELYTVNAEHQKKITELSELTRDMDHLLESTEVHTIFLDSDLTIRKFTPRIADKFNFMQQDVGRKIYDFTHSIDCEELPSKIRRVIESGTTYQEEVTDIHDCWFLMRILPYRAAGSSEEDPPIDGALLTLIDVTKLKETSAALEESVRQRDQFLAMLSHELRNPLGTIVNATHLLDRNKQLDSETAEAVAVIRRQSSHMGSLLADLLDVTRVSQGKIQLQKRPFDLLQTIDVAIETVRVRCDARDQVVATELPTDQEIWINGSEPRILQVISNLLTNASKYSGHSQTIRLRVESKDGKAIIRVEDEGVGIQPDQIDRVFEMFMQSDRTLDRADGGLGVGLTLVRSLCELHGGAISVHSEGEGKGSQFVVELPMCEPIQPIPKQDKFAATDSSPTRVVLVEDSVDASKMLAFLLEDAGYQVSMAHDGKRGMELIREQQPEAAVIDIGLPEITGYDLARMIRAEDSLDGVYLIALTGYGQATDREDALNAGFDEHLVKPVDPDLLHRMITERQPLPRISEA